MVLAGIGGRTIEEARERMPVSEVYIWQDYIAKNGPLSMQKRIEYATAQLAMILANQNRDPKTAPIGLREFLLWQEREDAPEQTDEVHQVFNELSRVSKPAERKGKRLWVRATDDT